MSICSAGIAAMEEFHIKCLRRNLEKLELKKKWNQIVRNFLNAKLPLLNCARTNKRKKVLRLQKI